MEVQGCSLSGPGLPLLIKVSPAHFCLMIMLNSKTSELEGCAVIGGKHSPMHRRQRVSYFWTEVKSESHSVVSNSLRPHRLYSPWNSLGQNTGVGSLSLLQGIFPTQGSNPGFPHCRQILYQLSHKGIPRILEWVAYFLLQWIFLTQELNQGSPALQVDSLSAELSGKPYFWSKSVKSIEEALLWCSKQHLTAHGRHQPAQARHTPSRKKTLVVVALVLMPHP